MTGYPEYSLFRGVDDMPDGWQTLPGAVYAANGMNYKQIVQDKNYQNCWLIAALASVAFKQVPTSSIGAVQKDHPLSYSFKFWGYNPKDKVKTGYLQETSGDVLLSDDMVTHARHATIQKDIWPTLYEKAFYQFLGNYYKLTEADAQTTTFKASLPDYSAFGSGEALKALWHLTGYSGELYREISTKNYDANSVFSEIYSKCSLSYNKIAGQKMIDFPAIASTYDPAAGDALPQGAVYGNSTVAKKHTYSLLGVYGVPANAPDKKFIVLRDPLGPTATEPSQNGVNRTSTWWGIQFTDVTDGIFALSAEQFVLYFKYYGWRM